MRMNIKSTGKGLFRQWHLIAAGLTVFDIFAVCLSYFLALWLRHDGKFTTIPLDFLSYYYRFILIAAAFTVLVFWMMKMYHSIWSFAGQTELLRGVGATLICCIFHYFGITFLFGRMPHSYHVFGIVIQFVLTMGIRFSYRALIWFRNYITYDLDGNNVERIMLIGAGKAGQLILRDIQSNPKQNGLVKCIIDDMPATWGRFIDGIPVEGGRDEILACAEKYKIDKIFIAIPSASAEAKRDILNICKETGCELKNLPSMDSIYCDDLTLKNMKDVSVEDLLGRDPIKVDNAQIFDYLSDKVVLITGAAGSIGSELSRQIAAHAPKQLILLDIYENSTYELQLELKDDYPQLNLTTLIGSVRDSRKLNDIFGTYKPEVVFHAAAHKHVPLMEDSPCEAIKNNTIGTYKTAYAAMMHGCKRFVLISTDKAVNPTNIMGASKRLCEMVIQSFDRKIKEGRPDQIPNLFTHAAIGMAAEKTALPADVKTEFVAVRFGNVLGSNGSVIPVFKRQIAKGGPVTVTHPDIIRYFMTIPEAVSLVLQAATYAKGGEIFVLDMGSAVKIDTLARNLIRLSGFKPDVDIKVEYTGLRPGEKLYEEKLMAEEGMKKTPSELIHIGSPIQFDTERFLERLKDLLDAAYGNDHEIRELVAQIVETYHPAGEHGSEEKGKAYESQMRQMAEIGH